MSSWYWLPVTISWRGMEFSFGFIVPVHWWLLICKFLPVTTIMPIAGEIVEVAELHSNCDPSITHWQDASLINLHLANINQGQLKPECLEKAETVTAYWALQELAGLSWSFHLTWRHWEERVMDARSSAGWRSRQIWRAWAKAVLFYLRPDVLLDGGGAFESWGLVDGSQVTRGMPLKEI